MTVCRAAGSLSREAREERVLRRVFQGSSGESPVTDGRVDRTECRGRVISFVVAAYRLGGVTCDCAVIQLRKVDGLGEAMCHRHQRDTPILFKTQERGRFIVHLSNVFYFLPPSETIL